MNATQADLDMRVLMASAQFRRFLLQVARQAGIWIPTAGATDSLQYREGSRSLGLEIIDLAARGLPRGASREDVIALLLSQSTPKETDVDESQSENEFDEQR